MLARQLQGTNVSITFIPLNIQSSSSPNYHNLSLPSLHNYPSSTCLDPPSAATTLAAPPCPLHTPTHITRLIAKLLTTTPNTPTTHLANTTHCVNTPLHDTTPHLLNIAAVSRDAPRTTLTSSSAPPNMTPQTKYAHITCPRPARSAITCHPRSAAG